MKISKIFLLGLLIILSSCSSTPTLFMQASFEKFKSLLVGETTTEEVINVLGSPDKTIYLGKENQIVGKSDRSQWVYKVKDLDKLYLYFDSNILTSKSWNVDKYGDESSVAKVLRDIPANWKVVSEPITNPHAAPINCYLEDLGKGILIKVHGFDKYVSEVSIWSPTKHEKSIQENLLRNVGKEFCLAGRCSKASTQKPWNHDQCEWLRKMVK
jgi:hypothetical protein